MDGNNDQKITFQVDITMVAKLFISKVYFNLDLNPHMYEEGIINLENNKKALQSPAHFPSYLA